MTILLILPNQTMSLTLLLNQMEEAYVYSRKTKVVTILTMLLLPLTKRKSLSIDCGLLQGLSKMKTVNMTTEFRNSTLSNWVESGLELETLDVTTI
jgi:hypothetical protein